MSSCSVRIFDRPRLAAAAGDACVAGLSGPGSTLAGLAAVRTMQPVYDNLVSADTRTRGPFSETAFARPDEVGSAGGGDASFAETAVAAIIEGPRSSGCPASLLRTYSDRELFLDRAAAKDLS